MNKPSAQSATGARPAEPPTIISISNPAAGETYMLNSKEKIAHKMKVTIEARPAGAAEAGRAGRPMSDGCSYRRHDGGSPATAHGKGNRCCPPGDSGGNVSRRSERNVFR